VPGLAGGPARTIAARRVLERVVVVVVLLLLLSSVHLPVVLLERVEPLALDLRARVLVEDAQMLRQRARPLCGARTGGSAAGGGARGRAGGARTRALLRRLDDIDDAAVHMLRRTRCLMSLATLVGGGWLNT
jgi:hypothetical protein